MPQNSQGRARGYKLFSCSTQLSMKFIMLMNVKMPIIVGILTFISMINTTSERLKARIFFICRFLVFMSISSSKRLNIDFLDENFKNLLV